MTSSERVSSAWFTVNRWNERSWVQSADSSRRRPPFPARRRPTESLKPSAMAPSSQCPNRTKMAWKSFQVFGLTEATSASWASWAEQVLPTRGAPSAKVKEGTSIRPKAMDRYWNAQSSGTGPSLRIREE